MLTWRVWAKKSMIDEMGGLWVPVLLLIASAFVSYLLLTVVAVSLADQPRIRRALLREMIDYKAVKAARASVDGVPANADGVPADAAQPEPESADTSAGDSPRRKT